MAEKRSDTRTRGTRTGKAGKGGASKGCLVYRTDAGASGRPGQPGQPMPGAPGAGEQPGPKQPISALGQKFHDAIREIPGFPVVLAN